MESPVEMIKLAGPATTWPYVVVIVISVAIAIIGFFLVVHGLMAKGNRTFVVGMVAVALGLLSLAVWGSILNEVDSSDLKHRKTIALEQQLHYSNVDLNNNKFTASNNGTYVHGRLVDAGHDLYIVIIDS